jgi:butyrate kinase
MTMNRSGAIPNNILIDQRSSHDFGANESRTQLVGAGELQLFFGLGLV